MTRRQVPESEGRIWAETRGFTHFETSALNENGIKDMFEVRTVLFGQLSRTDIAIVNRKRLSTHAW